MQKNKTNALISSTLRCISIIIYARACSNVEKETPESCHACEKKTRKKLRINKSEFHVWTGYQPVDFIDNRYRAHVCSQRIPTYLHLRKGRHTLQLPVLYKSKRILYCVKRYQKNAYIDYLCFHAHIITVRAQSITVSFAVLSAVCYSHFSILAVLSPRARNLSTRRGNKKVILNKW